MVELVQLDTTRRRGNGFTQSIEWWDSETECTLFVGPPSAAPDLWSEYLGGAHHSYRKHGVECALDIDALRDGGDTTLFFVALDDRGRMLAGVRAKGPLTGADDSHAVVEWAGQPGLRTVRKMIDDRAPFGILEMKAAWVTASPERSPALTNILARTGFWAMAMMDIQFCMATSAAHVLDRWGSSGGVVAAIPAAPYPDERYRTKMMWWDRRTFAGRAEPGQLSKIIVEMGLVAQHSHRLTPIVVQGGSSL